MKRHLSTLLAFVCATALAAPFTLVEEGRPASAIVVSRWSDQQEALAAVQLQAWVRQMTGAELPILTSAYDHKFLAGWQDGGRLPEVAPYGELQPIFVEFDGGLASEEYRLEVAETHIRIQGGSSYALLYGVDALLERLGILWPHPERRWREVPQTGTLRVEACEESSKPFFRIRAVHHHQSDHALFAWMGLNRLNYRLQNPPGWYDTGLMAHYGVRPFFISHSWHFWVTPKALQEHPEWNPVIGGERRTVNAEGNESLLHYQMCIGNPELRKHVVEQMKQYLRKNPQMPIVPLEANDGDGYCECEACQAYGATLSERFFRFVAEIAEEVGREFPKVTVLCLSYGPHTEVPSVRLPENVGIGVVYNHRNYARPLTDASNRPYYEQLIKWAEACPGRVYIYELWSKTRFVGWPHPYAKVFAEDIRLYRDLKVAGLCPEGIHPSALQEYLRGKLSWNPDQEWQGLLKEFCAKMYGEAAGPMEEYHLLMENRMAEHGKNLDDLTSISEFVAPIDQTALELLDQAAAQADTPQIAERVAAEREGFLKLHNVLEQWMPCSRDVVTAEMRKANLLPNGDFENGWKNLGADTRWGEYTFEVIDGQAYHGKKCGQVTVVTQGWGRFVLEASGLDISKKYTLYCAVKCLDGAEGGNFWFCPGGMPAQLYTLGPTNGEWYRAVFRDIEIREGKITVLPTVHDIPTKGRVLYDDIVLLPQE